MKSMNSMVRRWVGRILFYGTALLLLGFAGSILSLRYFFLPNIEQYRETIASSISKAAGQRVTIGGITADWHGLNPHLELKNVVVYDQNGQPGLSLDRVGNTLSWLSVFSGQIHLKSIVIDQPSLSVRREADGLIYVAGMAVNRPDTRSNFGDWLLDQREIRVSNASITWEDHLRNAPPLTLIHVSLRLVNRFGTHRFGIHGEPPPGLGLPVDLRGETKGDSVNDLEHWQGELYANAGYLDIAPWKTWIPLPPQLQKGQGAVRAWLSFSGLKPTQLTADLQLKAVHARLSQQRPQLELTALSGRLGWRSLEGGYELQAKQLKFEANNHLRFPSTDISFRHVKGKEGEEGELHTTGLNLGTLNVLAGYLPLDSKTHQQIAQLKPVGKFKNLDLDWNGEITGPSRYKIKATFENFGLQPYRKLPGFSGMGGSLDANEKGGTLSLNGKNTGLNMPLLFASPLKLDTLNAQTQWRIRNKKLDLQLSNVAFSNSHLAGTVRGNYKSAERSPGIVDISGRLDRADARYVGLYLPLVLGEAERSWIASAILGGKAEDVALRLKGNLNDFPFIKDKNGLFQVLVKVKDVTLDYASGWPRIANIQGTLDFHGNRMDINADRASIFGVALSKVHVAIPDLLTFDEILEVDGQAQGSTEDVLKFVNQSPVAEWTGHVTDGMHATGNGKLALKMRMPLDHTENSAINGNYQFLNNQISGAGWPLLEKVNGRLDFTGSSVGIPQMTLQIFGGPASLSALSQADGTVRANIRGRIVAQELPRVTGIAATRYLQGTTEWRGAISMRDNLANLAIDSSLQGLASTLPAPLGKAAQDTMPLHIERKVLTPSSDLLSLRLGNLLYAHLQREVRGQESTIERGTVSFGSEAPVPAQHGLVVSGAIKQLDLDQWRGLEDSSGGKSGLELSGLNLHIGKLDAFGRRFHEVQTNLARRGDALQGTIESKEAGGEVSWQSAGAGKITARLKHLLIPEEVQSISAHTPSKTGTELPVLDIMAENFQVHAKKLGKLELLAVNRKDDWQIQTLKLSNPDGILQMSGQWQSWLTQPTTRLKLDLSAADLGKLLGRLGYPDMIKAGTASLTGNVSWDGPPQSLDLPSLSGNLELEVKGGQFLKIEPGVGKLLGILSLQALPRRIVLDFRDVFSQGFAFDSISASVGVSRGIATTRDFLMDGPSAKVAMAGETDLGKGTQDLQVKVLPQVSDSVSVAGALLGGPVAGLTTYLVQKMLRDPFNQIGAYEYKITGTWEDPKIEKVSLPVGTTGGQK